MQEKSYHEEIAGDKNKNDFDFVFKKYMVGLSADAHALSSQLLRLERFPFKGSPSKK